MLDTCICSPKQTTFVAVLDFNDTPFPQYKGVIISKCARCGLLKTIKRPKRFDPAQSRDEMYEENSADFIQIFLPYVKKLKKYLPSHARVLDVGCSSGILLELLDEAGFDVRGLEPNKHACKQACKKFGKKVANMTMEEFVKKNKKASFECIMYNHVLEHTEDPNKELRLASSLLKKNGMLLIGVPNRRNLVFYLRRQYWESLMPLEHIWQFSDHDIFSLLNTLGFEIVETWYDNHVRADYPSFKKVYFNLLCFMNKILNTGEAVTIIARKIS